MAHDFGSIDDLDNLSDAELRGRVRERLGAASLDMRGIVVEARDGLVRLTGRVGTDGERRIAERTLMDGLGLLELENELIVDPLARELVPEAADDAAAVSDADGGIVGDAPRAIPREAAHLEEDLDAELYGTSDRGKAIQDGVPYEPPTGSTPEGYSGSEGGLESGEHH